ncbi:MAG: hypothetical protein HS122_01805 [Opitutaceae bacterium]|nr:hypothetical protein [Opitutaceae bacterium]
MVFAQLTYRESLRDIEVWFECASRVALSCRNSRHGETLQLLTRTSIATGACSPKWRKG